MAQYSKMASGTVVSSGANSPDPGSRVAVSLPFVPDFIEISNKTIISGTGDGVSRAWWETDMGQGAAFITTTTNATSDLTSFIDALGGSGSTSGNTAGTGISTIQGGLALQYGPVYQHTSTQDFTITDDSGPLITTTTPHNLKTGDVVIFQDLYQTPTTGMPQICGIPFKVTVAGSETSFRIGWDISGSNYTAFNTATSVGNVGSFKRVLFNNLYAPGRAFLAQQPEVWDFTTLKTQFFTTADHNFVVGQAVAFHIPPIWGLHGLNSLPDGRIPGSSNYAYVTEILSSYSFVCDVNFGNLSPFNQNVPVADVPGLSFPQALAVGDINTGSTYFGFGSPSVNKALGTTSINTNNGPTVDGSYINATYMAFILGLGVIGNRGDILEWRAYAHDRNT